MRGLRLGMRWWLALAFASIVALTSLVVAGNALHSTSQSLRGHAQDLAIGNSLRASVEFADAADKGNLDQAIQRIATARRLSLFAFDRNGSPVAPTSLRSRGVQLRNIPSRLLAVSTAIRGNRYIHTANDGSSTIVALPLRRGGVAAVLAYSPRPDVATELDIVKRSIIESALLAVGIGAAAGIVVAILIVRRLRRIGTAARAIAAGDFEAQLKPQWRDELGELAATIDLMRQRLRESFDRMASEHHRLEGLLERLHEGVVLVDRDLSVGYANGAARRILGVDTLAPGDPLPDPWREPSLRTLVVGLFRRGAIAFEARAAPDAEHTYRVVGIPVEKGVDTTVLVLTDVSERERREAAEREFVTNAAHELRTPLAAIGGAVEVLQSGAKDDPVERDRFLGHIERECARLTRLGRAMLVLARAQTGSEAPRLGRVPLRALLDEVAASLRPFEGVTVRVDCADDLEALSDRDLLEQVLVNLAANAARHTDSGSIVLAARQNGRHELAIELRDTGTGISREHRDRIFDRFYRGGNRDGDGFGLGLAIVRASVQALGGSVEIESEPDSGTTARVVILSAVKTTQNGKRR
jgi:signal transduction histidine kinase/HAMP domain-containing protein